MPQYVKTVWVNGTVPALNDSNLNKMEQGIFDAFRQDGSTTMSGQLVTTAGSASTPAIAPTGDTNTGIFFPAADTIAFGEGGGEAMRITSTGNVGIGTTAPDVFSRGYSGTILGISSSGQSAIELNSGTGNKAFLDIGVAGTRQGYLTGSSTEIELGSATTIPLYLITNNNIRATITSAGNVGIGTISPNTILQVDDTYGGYRAGIIVKNTADGATGRGTGIEWHSGTGTTKGEISLTAIDANRDGYDMKFLTTATGGSKTTKMTITGAGNVGIGTTNPFSATGYSALTINNTDGGILSLYSSGTESARIQGYTIGANAGVLSLEGIGSSGEIRFRSGSSEKMRITSAGNVGIGTTSPTAPLEVQSAQGVIKLASTTGTNSTYHKIDNTGGTLTLGIDNSTGSSQFGAGNYAGGLWHSGNYNLTFGTNNSVRMTISGGGNVGIGTTSPSEKLVVNGNISSLYGIHSTTLYNGNLNFYNAGSATKYINVSDDSSTIPAISLDKIGSSTKTCFLNGNVGIGTTSPSNKLQVVSSTASTIGITTTTAGSEATPATINLSFYGYNNEERGRIRVLDQSANNYNTKMIFYTSSDPTNTMTERMQLSSSGYLLIGYTSSNGAYPLQVNGQIFATSSTIATSDGRYKKDVVALDGALDIVKALNPVQFSWKDHPVHKFNTDVPTVGFIAQEVEQALADKSYLTSIIKKSECTWETETGETIEREVTRDVEKQVTREVEREVTETIDGEEVTRTVTEEITETIIEQVTEIVTEPVKETHTEEFLGIAESNLIAILTKAVKELTAKVEALEAQLNGN